MPQLGVLLRLRPSADCRFSLVAQSFLYDLAKRLGDDDLADWIHKYGAVEYKKGPRGYVGRLDSRPKHVNVKPPDELYIGLRSDIVALISAPRRAKAEFVGGHELGHLDQVVKRRLMEGRLFTRTLFRQELEASSVGGRLIMDTPARWPDTLYRFRWYHRVIATEAAFPIISHVVYLISLLGSLYWAFGKVLYGFFTRWAYTLAGCGPTSQIQPEVNA